MGIIYRACLFCAILICGIASPLAGGLRAAEITNVTVAGVVFDPGDTIAVTFTTDGAFDNNNVFTLQVSSISGSFAQARSIGVLEGTGGGTILGKLPCDLSEGTGYRVRVVASSPSVTGPDNGGPLAIRPRPVVKVTASGPTTICAGDSVTLTGEAGYKAYRWNTGDTSRIIVVRSAGIYTLTATDSNDCGLVSRATISVRPAVKPLIRIRGITLEIDSGYVHYQWYFREQADGMPLPGDTSRSIQVGRSGSYWVAVTDINGCSGRSDTMFLILDEVEWTTAADAGVKIYPQPARDRVTIETELARPTAVTITMNDMSGRELLRFVDGRSSGHYRREISIAQLPAGAYLLRIELGERRLVEKVIKREGGR